MTCGDIKETKFVGAGCIIGFRRLNRIASIDEIDKIHALDDAAVLDVETGDDAGFQHHAASRAARMAASASPASSRPS